MSNYKVVTLIGTSENSWEDAVRNVVEAASKSIRNIRNVEIVQQDAKVSEGKVVVFRAKVNVSFKFEEGNE